MAESKNSCGQNGDTNSEITRREFVRAATTVTSGVAFGLPFPNEIPAAGKSNDESRRLPALALTVNGRLHRIRIDPRTSLLDLLREELALTGTKKGCDRGQCGACTVLVNGRRIVSCLSLAATHEGDEVTTVEGLAQDGKLHPVQQAFLLHDGFQCGYCTPGQICSAVAMLGEWRRGDASVHTAITSERNETVLSRAEVSERMSGNLCRCSAYPNIVSAVLAAHGEDDRR